MKLIRPAILVGAVALVFAIAFTGHLSGDDTLSGEWRMTYSEARDSFRFEARMHTATSNSNWSESDSLAKFRALHVCEDQLGKSVVHCDLNREAGTVTLDGHFSGESGSGTFRFACREDFRRQMSGLGYPGLSVDECFGFARRNIGIAFVQQVRSTGFSSVSINQLENLSIHNVSIDYLKAMLSSVAKEAGSRRYRKSSHS